MAQSAVFALEAPLPGCRKPWVPSHNITEFRQDSTCNASTQIVEVVGGSEVQGRSLPHREFKDNLSCVKSDLSKGGRCW